MKKVWIWIIAVLLTIAASVYQRMSGPTYPLRINTELNDVNYVFSLNRSATTTEACRVEIPDNEIISKVHVVYKKYPGNFSADTIKMNKADDFWNATLPVQPAAGKLKYFIQIFSGEKKIYSNKDNAAIVRYKDEVPAWALIPHVLAMFLAMLLSTVALLMIIFKNGNFRKVAFWAFGLLVIGGFVFGPVVQNFAFGQAWTGWPVGKDLTDNKMLIAGIIWLVAVVFNLKKSRPWFVAVAAVVLLSIFTIPHSARGSEFDYKKEKIRTG